MTQERAFLAKVLLTFIFTYIARSIAVASVRKLLVHTTLADLAAIDVSARQ